MNMILKVTKIFSPLVLCTYEIIVETLLPQLSLTKNIANNYQTHVKMSYICTYMACKY